MQITVFGASGNVGRRVVQLALERGFTVVAFVHKNNPFAATPNLLVKKGDIYDTTSVAEALKGSQAVISTLGSWGTPTKDVLTNAMRAIIPAMEAQKITRIVTLTGSGAADPGKPASAGHKVWLKFLAVFPIGKVFKDGEAHLAVLAATDLDWTTVRSPVMTGDNKTTYQLKARTPGPFASIGRQAVATAMVDQLKNTDYLRQAPIIYRK